MASAQTATPVAPTPSLWSYQVAYDTKTNKPLLIGSYSAVTIQVPPVLQTLIPKFSNWSLAATVFGGTEIGATGVIGGEGFQLETVFHGVTLDAAIGEGYGSGSSGAHLIFFLGGSVPVK